MSRSQLSNADFSYSYLWGGNASVVGATMTNITFTNAYLGSLKLSAVSDNQLKGANFIGACLANCIFDGANLTDALLDGACLQGASFKGATLAGANLDGAAIALKPSDPKDPDNLPLSVTLVTGDKEMTMPVDYAATDLPATATTGKTKCPASGYGPCTDQSQLVSPHSPSTWSGKSVGPIMSEAPTYALY